MRGFIYCRVSTKEQGSEDHYSLSNQEQRCRDYCRMKQWHVHSVRKDIASGKNDSREGFQTLRAAIAAGEIDVVLVYRLDRLSRNVRDIYDFLDTIKTTGVAFVSVTEGFDTTTAMGRAMLGVAAVFAQLTREMIAENTKDGILRRAEAGLYNGNKICLMGYDYSPESSTLSQNAAESEVVRQIYDWYTERKWGIERIAQVLNASGMRTKAGNQWAFTTVRKVLRNPIYAGYVRAGTGIVKGQHEAIIEQTQFELANGIARSRATMPPRTQTTRHLLSGLARCGICGQPFGIHYVNDAKRDEFGEPIRHRFYRHKPNFKAGDAACPGLLRTASNLENAIIDAIAEIASTGNLEKLVLKDVLSESRVGLRSKQDKRDKLLLSLTSLDEQFSQWADRLDAGKIDEHQFDLQNRRLIARKSQIRSSLTELEQELGATETIEMTFSEVKKALSDFPTVWSALELEEQREVLRLLVEHLKVFKTHVELKLLFMDPIELTLTTKRGRKPRVPLAA